MLRIMQRPLTEDESIEARGYGAFLDSIATRLRGTSVLGIAFASRLRCEPYEK
jgi:hypothetical protein